MNNIYECRRQKYRESPYLHRSSSTLTCCYENKHARADIFIIRSSYHFCLLPNLSFSHLPFKVHRRNKNIVGYNMKKYLMNTLNNSAIRFAKFRNVLTGLITTNF